MIIDNKTTIQDVIDTLNINDKSLEFQIPILRQVFEIAGKYIGKNIKIDLKSNFKPTNDMIILKRYKDIIIYKMKGT